MSKRFLKYETKHSNPLVDENGVLKGGFNVIEILGATNAIVINGHPYQFNKSITTDAIIYSELGDYYDDIIAVCSLGSIVKEWDEYDEQIIHEGLIVAVDKRSNYSINFSYFAPGVTKTLTFYKNAEDN